MANLVTHVHYAEAILNLLSPHAKEKASAQRDAFVYGSIGPDFLFVLREIGDKSGQFCNQMQYNNTFEVFSSIVDYIREKGTQAEYSYALGLLCHYVMDFHMHPFVNFFVEEGRFKDLPADQQQGIHSMIESALDAYVVTERMGYKESNLYNPAKHIKTTCKTRRAIASLYIGAINKIIGFDVTPFKFNLSIFLTRAFVAFATDKSGRKRKFFSCKEGKTPEQGKKKVRNLMRPPEFYGEIDFLNLEKRPYSIARNRAEFANHSAPELLDAALAKGVEYIEKFIAAVEGGTPLERKDFAINYEGVDTEIIK
ncbi:MAG: zinc dependent phospholipase C family protein [Clostridia bacterium]